MHSDNEVEFVDYTINGDTVSFETTKLSDFAFVVQKGHGFCIGWIVFILVLLELLFLGLYVILYLGKPLALIEKCKLAVLSDKLGLLSLIGLCVSGAIFLFAFIVLCCHQCAITIISFIFALLILCPFVFFFLLDRGILTMAMVNDCINKIKEKFKKVEENKEEKQQEEQVEAQDSEINNKAVVEPQQKEE